MVATGVPVTPAQPPDVHIYIGWIHTASIFIYIMDQGAKGPVPAVPAIPFCPCHQPPRGWILLWGTHSPRWNGSCCGTPAAPGRTDPAAGQLLGDGSCSGTLTVPAFAPLLCQALAVPGCPVPWAGMAVLYVPSDNKPAGLPWGCVAGPEWTGERGEGCCGVSHRCRRELRRSRCRRASGSVSSAKKPKPRATKTRWGSGLGARGGEKRGSGGVSEGLLGCPGGCGSSGVSNFGDLRGPGGVVGSQREY